jgi:hypothetical protein
MTMADFNKDEYDLIAGEPKYYQSSQEVIRSFCAECGSPVSYTHSNYPGHIEIPIGIFDTPEKLAPEVHIWTSQKIFWAHICDHLPQREKD